MPKILILDTETTGLSAQDEPIEVALALFEVDENGILIADLQTYVGRRQPSVPIGHVALKIHGIRPSEVAGKDFDHELVRALIASADILVAHNADFDARMLKSLFPEVLIKDWRCTFKQWPWPSAPGARLSNAAKLLGVEEHASHSALGDVTVLKSCLFGGSTGRSYVKQLLQAGSHQFGSGRAKTFGGMAKALDPETQAACTALLGIISDVMADRHLDNQEIASISSWLERHLTLVTVWPISIVGDLVREILADGIVTERERALLTAHLDAVTKVSFRTINHAVSSNALELDEVDVIAFDGQRFCFSGNFLFGDKDLCAAEIVQRGGIIVSGVSKKLDFLVVGGLGSPEWKHGSFGTKIEKAMEYRANGSNVRLIHEQTWIAFLC